MISANILANLINVTISLVEAALGLRLLLRLLGANPNTPFVSWIYKTSDPLLDPFRGIFPTRILEGGFVFDFSTLFAMIIYALLGYFLIELLELPRELSRRKEK